MAGAVAATEAASRSAATASVAATASPSTRRTQRGHVKVKEGSVLAQRAQDEYVYVGQDLRRIAVVAAILFAALIVFWLSFTVVDPFGIY